MKFCERGFCLGWLFGGEIVVHSCFSTTYWKNYPFLRCIALLPFSEMSWLCLCFFYFQSNVLFFGWHHSVSVLTSIMLISLNNLFHKVSNQYVHKINMLGLWLGLHCIWRSIWEELISKILNYPVLEHGILIISWN